MNFHDRVIIGPDGVDVARVGFGCCPMGGHDWGDTDEREMCRAVQVGMDEGVNLFDTADVYGLGTSERILGRALGRRRSEAFVATKFGVRRSANGTVTIDNSSSWLHRAVNASLRRLGTDYIDLYQVHYWDGVTPWEQIFDDLQRLVEQGKVRCFGITNLSPDETGVNRPAELVSFSFEFSVANRSHESVIKRNLARGALQFLSWGSLGQGILSGKYDRNTRFPAGDRRRREAYENFHGEKLERNLKIVDCLTRLQMHYPERTRAQMAIRWILDTFGASIALTGIKRPAQVRENVGALGWRLEQHDRATLDAVSNTAQVMAQGQVRGRDVLDGR